MGVSRAVTIFLQSIKSPATRKQYDHQLNGFVKYYKLKSIESILEIEPKQIQIYLEDYIIHLKDRGLSRSYINQGVCALQLFLTMNDVVLNWKKLKKLLSTIEVKKAGDRPYSNDEIKKMVEVARSLRNKAIIHFMAASGVRVGALPTLRLKHIAEMPRGCKSVLVYASDKDEYHAFLTNEASKVLDDYLTQRRNDGEVLGPESPVFRARYDIGNSKAKPMTLNSLTSMMKDLLKDANIRKQKDELRFEQMRFHGLRKRFATILKLNPNINQNAVERLLGHKNGLDGSYYRPTKEELFTEYLKGVEGLTVDDAARVLVQLEKERGDKTELERMKAEYEKRISELEKHKNEMMSEVAIERMINRMNSYYLKSGKKPKITEDGEKQTIHYEPPKEGWDFAESDITGKD